MVNTVKLYVSAANDLPNERELIGHIVTEIPVTLGWQINHTPLGNKLIDEQLIIDADLHLLIFGADIRAPIGYEWHLSRMTGRKPAFFIKENIPRTIAGRDFLKIISNYPKLLNYNSMADFRKQILTHLSLHLIRFADFFTIKSEEFERLSQFNEHLKEIEPNILDDVTGEDSIILTRERFLPKDGVLIQTPDDDPNIE